MPSILFVVAVNFIVNSKDKCNILAIQYTILFLAVGSDQKKTDDSLGWQLSIILVIRSKKLQFTDTLDSFSSSHDVVCHRRIIT